MALVCNGTPVKKVICNGVEVKKVFIGDEQVFVNWDGSVLGNLDMFPEEAFNILKYVKKGGTEEYIIHPNSDSGSFYINVSIDGKGKNYQGCTIVCLPVDLTDCKTLQFSGNLGVRHSYGVHVSGSAYIGILSSIPDASVVFNGPVSAGFTQLAYEGINWDDNAATGYESTINGSPIDVSSYSGIKYICIALKADISQGSSSEYYYSGSAYITLRVLRFILL